MASMYSRIHGPGGDQFMPKRRWMCPLTWDPNPSVKRPLESFCNDHALIAVIVGLRGKAIATLVASLSRVVA
jgi:hypothetical protein